jgi:hypothetical protein
MGAEQFHADGTDLTKLIVAFRNFAKAPKKEKYFSSQARPDASVAHPDAYPSSGFQFSWE